MYFTKNNYNKEDITTKYQGKNTVTIKDKQGDKLGTLKIYYKNDLIDTIDITLDEKTHFSILKFITSNIYIISAIITYAVITLTTILIIKRIKNKR